MRSNQTKPPKKVEASSSNATITSQADWDAGTKNNVDSSSVPGSIKISNASSGTKYDLSGGTISEYPSVGNGGNAIDGNFSSYWGPVTVPVGPRSGADYWTIDHGSQIAVSRVKIKFDGGEVATLSGSNDGSGFTDVHEFGPPPDTYDVALGSIYNYRYWRVELWSGCCGAPIDYHMKLYELELYSSGSATHTTAPTQIDGGANFWQWETFTDSKTTPANTSVTYRYRTSANGTEWTSWVGSIGSVTSRQGDDSNNPTKYRYLQIEATLSNTDGASTPTIDSYTIGYHTNQPPNKPTAMTAVVN